MFCFADERRRVASTARRIREAGAHRPWDVQTRGKEKLCQRGDRAGDM